GCRAPESLRRASRSRQPAIAFVTVERYLPLALPMARWHASAAGSTIGMTAPYARSVRRELLSADAVAAQPARLSGSLPQAWSWVRSAHFAIAIFVMLAVLFAIFAAVPGSPGSTAVPFATPPRQSAVGSPASFPRAIFSRQPRVAFACVTKSFRIALLIARWHDVAALGGTGGAGGVTGAQYGFGSHASGNPSPSLSRWSAFGVSTQLSWLSNTPSPSLSPSTSVTTSSMSPSSFRSRPMSLSRTCL